MKPEAAGKLLRKYRPGAAGLFLLLAFFSGGLRTTAAWLAFSALFLPWFVLDSAPFNPGKSPAVLLFVFWMAAAAAFSPDIAVSSGCFARYALLGLVYFSAASSAEGSVNWLAAVKFLGGAAAAALVAQRLAGLPLFGLIGENPNYSAVFAAAAFPAALLSAEGSRRNKISGGALAVLLAAGLLASGSRGALAAAFLSAAGALALAGRRKTFAALGLCVLAAAAFLPSSFWAGLLKLSDPRAFERPHIWRSALEIAARSPFFGAGPGLFGRAFEAVKFPYFDGISWYGHSTLNAHGELFNLAAEAGFPAAVFFAAAAWLALAGKFRERLPLAACAAAAFMQGGVDMIFYSGAPAMLLWGTLGFVSAGPEAAEGKSRKAKLLAALTIFAGLVFSFAAVHTSRPAFRDAALKEAARGNNPALALALLRSEGLEAPKDPFLSEREGRAFAALGFKTSAEAAFRRALALEPCYAAARLDLAQLYSEAGLAAQARVVLYGGPPAAQTAPRNPYQSALLAADGDALGRLQKNLWKNNQTGAAIVPGRKKP